MLPITSPTPPKNLAAGVALLTRPACCGRPSELLLINQHQMRLDDLGVIAVRVPFDHVRVHFDRILRLSELLRCRLSGIIIGK